MKRDANRDAAYSREVFLRNGSLRAESCVNRVFGPREDRAKRIAHRLENVSAVRVDGCAYERIVTPDRVLHRGAVALPALRTSFDIAKEKSDRSCRERSN